MIQFSTMELLGALVVILGFQFTVIKMLGTQVVKSAVDRLEAVEDGLSAVKSDLKLESQKTRNRMHGIELALERKGIRVRITPSDDEDELDG